MTGAYIRVEGAEKVRAYLQSLKEGAGKAGDETVLVGTNLVYAFGIETGRHRGGRLARRAGGAFYLRDAFNAVKPRIQAALIDALQNGAAAVLSAMTKLGFDVQREAQKLVPVRTGSLRRSIHTAVSRR